MNMTTIENNDLSNIYEINSVDEIYDDKINYNNMDIIPINYFKHNWFKDFCDTNYIIKDFSVLYDIIQSLNLTNFEKNLILIRFRRINIFCIKNYKSISNYYIKSKLFIIICGILNPSLLSINNNQEEKIYTFLFWTVWSLQLLVSLVTSFVSFYKWDKKYFLYSSYKSKINQEIWLYLELTGRYGYPIETTIETQHIENNEQSKNNIIDVPANHKNKLNLFLERIEALFKKLKDFDLEIETSEEESKESRNHKRYLKKKKNPDNSPEININDTPSQEETPMNQENEENEENV
jgi:hypothetical protein